MKKTNELSIYVILSEDVTSFSISSSGKIESVQEIKMKILE